MKNGIDYSTVEHRSSCRPFRSPNDGKESLVDLSYFRKVLPCPFKRRVLRRTHAEFFDIAIYLEPTLSHITKS